MIPAWRIVKQVHNGPFGGFSAVGATLTLRSDSESLTVPWKAVVHDLYGGTPGTGNTFHDNLTYNNPGGIGHLTAVHAYNNVAADPLYVDAGALDYRLQSGSPAAGWGVWNGT